ncbi:uncharacterized protein TRIADDRAFT_61359 [Trichoplax adhaerens]|uniref:Equilibrative nucleoside transporter 1 n=1 Tax=Trichoplax adhaerens TaxID=10228 RepID=B3SAS1_TRIAD|nr:hypothetical protein TRIADDRAFT_61359 [Trichoplax adhaerens]EDV20151.1 hypothetical protein TRIADDRAFT_61359 [Trichoplax adhaerens]|eukprot:XP_002117312.1 hypothetical protein TRIADDRAFT_61359 [Trichoplax adhaerens]
MYQGSLFGLAGIFPKEYTLALITGQALAGVFTAVVNIISLVDASREKTLLDHEDDNSGTEEEYEPIPNEDSRFYRIMHILKKTWPVFTAHFLCFTITYGIFPSLPSRVISVNYQSHSPLTGPLFIPVACFLIYAVAEVVSGVVSRWILLPRQNQGLSLLFLSISRIAFIPLFLYCNVQPRKHLPVKIYNDVAYIMLVLLFAFSHGYINTLCSMYTPKRVRARFSESAGVLAYFALMAGVTAGTVLSFGLIAIV